jgi:hypothetical protein
MIQKLVQQQMASEKFSLQDLPSSGPKRSMLYEPNPMKSLFRRPVYTQKRNGKYY